MKGEKIVDVQCSKNDLSHRWLLIGIGSLLNMKTFKCLQWNNDLQELTTTQCKSLDITQHWTRATDGNITLNTPTLTAKPLYSNSVRDLRINIYKGKSFITIQLVEGPNSLS